MNCYCFERVRMCECEHSEWNEYDCVCVLDCIKLHFKENCIGGGDHQSDVLFVRVRRTDTDTHWQKE